MLFSPSLHRCCYFRTRSDVPAASAIIEAKSLLFPPGWSFPPSSDVLLFPSSKQSRCYSRRQNGDAAASVILSFPPSEQRCYCFHHQSDVAAICAVIGGDEGSGRDESNDCRSNSSNRATKSSAPEVKARRRSGERNVRGMARSGRGMARSGRGMARSGRGMDGTSVAGSPEVKTGHRSGGRGMGNGTEWTRNDAEWKRIGADWTGLERQPCSEEKGQQRHTALHTSSFLEQHALSLEHGPQQGASWAKGAADFAKFWKTFRWSMAEGEGVDGEWTRGNHLAGRNGALILLLSFHKSRALKGQGSPVAAATQGSSIFMALPKLSTPAVCFSQLFARSSPEEQQLSRGSAVGSRIGSSSTGGSSSSSSSSSSGGVRHSQVPSQQNGQQRCQWWHRQSIATSMAAAVVAAAEKEGMMARPAHKEFVGSTGTPHMKAWRRSGRAADGAWEWTGGDKLAGSVPARDTAEVLENAAALTPRIANINSRRRATWSSTPGAWSSTPGAWSTGRSSVLLGVTKEPQVLPRRRKHLAGMRGSSGTNSTAAYSAWAW
ncbi:unnamed protein product [Closterium sp. NIES-53]